MRDLGIGDFIQAGYPCLFMATIEPEVAQAKILQALTDQAMSDVKVGVWKATTGLLFGRQGEKGTQRGNDLLDALSFVVKQSEPVVLILHNVRWFLDDNMIVQQLVDSVHVARLRGSHIIFIGTHLALPPEWRNLVTFVDCPLPTQDKLAEDYRKLITAYKDDIVLPKSKEEVDDLINSAAMAAVGMDSMGAENAMALSMATAGTIDVRVIQSQKEQEVKKSDVLEFINTEESMDTLGGFVALKQWFSKRRMAFTKEAREYGLPYPKGVLIVGPAGTGKSLAAKSIASYLRLPLLRLDLGKVFRSLMGESEAAIRQALKVGEAVAPVVFWIDEIEKGMAGMRGSGELDSGVTARVISTILTWRQETTAAVMFVATANDIVTLPSMVYRRGRFDEVWATDLPNVEERKEIFKIHLAKRDRDPQKFNLDLLAAKTEDFVGAEIESVVVDGMYSAFFDGKEVSTVHVLKAIDTTVPQATRDVEEVKAIREWATQRARMVSEAVKPDAPMGTVRQLKSKK